MMNNQIYTITIVWNDEREAWTSSFSTREKALEYKARLEAKLQSLNMLNEAWIVEDSSPLDCEDYLDWLDEYDEDYEEE